MKNNKLFKTSMLAIALVSATSAYAIPTITVVSGANSVVVLDNQAGDTSPNLGVVNWSGNLGTNWTLNFDTGFTKPEIGTPDRPYMDLTFSARSQGAGTVTISFAEVGWAYIGGLIDSWGGVTAGEVTNRLYVNGQQILQQGPFDPAAPLTAFSSTGNVGVTLVPTDVLKLEVTITHFGAGLTTGDKEVKAPDGGSTVALLGLALGGVAAARRKFRI